MSEPNAGPEVERLSDETVAEQTVIIDSATQSLIDYLGEKLEMHPLSVVVAVLARLGTWLRSLDTADAVAYMHALADTLPSGNARVTAVDQMEVIFARLAWHFEKQDMADHASRPPAPRANDAPKAAVMELKHAEDVGASVMRERPGGKLLDVKDWCSSLSRDTVERLTKGAGSDAAFSLIGYVEDGHHRINCMAAGIADQPEQVIGLIRSAIKSAETYIGVGNPDAPPPAQTPN